jgi:hypothetical protein
MSKVTDLVFEHRNKGNAPFKALGTMGVILTIIIFLIFLSGFIIFLISAFKINIKYIWLADLSGLLAFLFGPYTYIKQNHYYFALTEDGTLIIKTVSGFFPRKYKMKLNDISEIAYSNPVKSLTVIFRNKKGKIIGNFNHSTMGYNQFRKYLDIISLKNKDIKIQV